MTKAVKGLTAWLCVLLAVAGIHRVSCSPNVVDYAGNSPESDVSLVQVEETALTQSKEKLEPFSTAMLALTTASIVAKVAKTTVRAFDALHTQEVSAYLAQLTTKTCNCLEEACKALKFSSTMISPTLGRSGKPVETALLKMSQVLGVRYEQCTSVSHHDDHLLEELHTVPGFALASLTLETIGLVEDFEHFGHGPAKSPEWFSIKTESMMKKLKGKLHEAPEIALDLLAEPDGLVDELFSISKSVLFAANPITYLMHKTVKAYSSWASLFTTSAAYVKRAKYNAVRRVDVAKDVENYHCRTLANQVLVLMNMLDEVKRDKESGKIPSFFEGRTPSSVDYNSCLTYVVDSALRDSLDVNGEYTEEAKQWCAWVLSSDIVWYTPLIKTMLGMIQSLEQCEWVSTRPRYYGAVHPGGRGRPVTAVLLDNDSSFNKFAMVDVSIVKASSEESLLAEVESLTAKEFGLTYKTRGGAIHFTSNAEFIMKYLVPRMNMCRDDRDGFVLVMWRQAMSRTGRVVGSPITGIDFVSDLEGLDGYVTVDVDLTCGGNDSSGNPLYLAYKKLGAVALIAEEAQERILAAKEGGVSLISSQVSEANGKLGRTEGAKFTPLEKTSRVWRPSGGRGGQRNKPEGLTPDWNTLLDDPLERKRRK